MTPTSSTTEEIGDPETSTLKGQAAFDLYSEGVRVWNTWADAHPGWTVDFFSWDFSQLEGVDFEEFRFPGNVYFSGAKFGKGSVDFSHAKFGKGKVFFLNAKFGEGNVDFSGTKFGEGDVRFSHTKFGKGNVDFSGTKFGKGNVDFSGTQFGEGNVDFKGTKFGEGNVDFSGTKFGEGDVNFQNIISTGSISFYRATLGENADSVSFENADIGGRLDLNKATFHRVPDLSTAHLGKGLSLVGTRITYTASPRDNRWSLNKALTPDDATYYRFFKKQAADAKDHEKEIEYFSMELRAHYGHQQNWFQYLPTLLYQKLSDYGRSVLRPTLAFVVMWLISAGIFHWQRMPDAVGGFKEAFWLATGHLFTFMPWLRGNRNTLLESLYGSSTNIPWGVQALALAESVLSLIFIFLIALALRNRLRL